MQAELRRDAIAKAKESDAVVMVMGLSPLDRRRRDGCDIYGFRGGDRTDIVLPKPQEQLIKDIQALGKTVWLVLMGGSALAVNWESENTPAILQTWYPDSMVERRSQM